MAIVCLYAWTRLGKSAPNNPEQVYFRLFFLLMGISAAIGSLVGHLFLHLLPFAWKVPGWMLGMMALAALVQASIHRIETVWSDQIIGRITWINRIVLLSASAWLIVALWFPIVEIHAAFGLIGLILPLEWVLFRKTGDVGSKYMLYGIGLLVTAVCFHIGKISMGVWFSFFDIAHIIMCAAFWCFLLGAEAKITEKV